jgi:hypothetical protein
MSKGNQFNSEVLVSRTSRTAHSRTERKNLSESHDHTKARFTRYTSEGLLTKRLTLLPDTSIELYGPPQETYCFHRAGGEFTAYPAVHPQYLTKTAAVMGRGQFVTDEVSTLDEFIYKLESMTSNECNA